MIQKTSAGVACMLAALSFLLGACGMAETAPGDGGETMSSQSPIAVSRAEESAAAEQSSPAESASAKTSRVITPTTRIMPLEVGLSAVSFAGESGFDRFLELGGAASDAAVADYVSRNLLAGAQGLSFVPGGFGCSTLAVSSPAGGALFGRNFDWEACEALVVTASPENGYRSVSTVNLDFLESSVPALNRLSEQARTLAALYAPLDGMNEKGLCAAVLMVQDSAVIGQDTGKPDLTTTTAVRLLLDRAATVEEALLLLRQYDLHSSMGMMVHFALSDAAGTSVAVEYVDNEMVVTDTPVLTNFYLAQGDKQGIGSSQSHIRYGLLMDLLSETPAMSMEQVRDALKRVSKQNFGEFESTEWSVVYNQTSGEVRYYHREDYENSFLFQVS